MRCVTCGVDLLAGKQFCHACGAKVTTPCRGCGAALDPAFRFCPDCGLRVDADAGEAPPPVTSEPLPPPSARPAAAAPAGAIEGERKLVTVLFCDLVGSTTIAEQIDPEEYRDVLRRYLDVVYAQVYRYEGVVNTLVGDGVMALFGAPVAHEQAPQSGVHAALAVRDAMQPLSEEMRTRHGFDLHVRIGVHTGPVVVGTVGDGRKMDYTATGDTPNIAARLQTLAPPDGVLISEATYRLVRGEFAVDPAGRLEVRGKSEPVTAYLVRDWNGPTASMALAEARGMTPFVGRGTELDHIEKVFRKVATGGMQVVTVVGNAGSGKSRLVYELRRRLGTAPAFFEGRCASMLQALPYHLFMSIFSRYFELDWQDEGPEACDKVAAKFGSSYAGIERRYPLLCRFLSLPIEHLADQPADELKRETFDAIAGLVLGEAAKAPTVMILEDLHWIDDPSRELLDELLHRLAGARVLVIATQRPEATFTWPQHIPLWQLVLGSLPDGDVLEIVRAVAGGSLPRELERVLIAKAGGSPFFAEEIVRALREEEHLVPGPDGSVRLARPLPDIPIPGTVQEVIAARLDRLSPEAKRVVQVAAVLGRQFRQSEVRALLAGENIDVERELGELERRGLMHRKNLLAADELRFGESLTQEVAYEGLLLRQRRQLHERVGDLLAAEGEEHTAAEDAALLAHHYALSDNHVKGVDALLHAAQAAEAVPSYRVASDLYRRAWLLAESVLGEREDGHFHRAALQAVNALTRLAVFFGAVEPSEAERAAIRGRELAEVLNDDESLAGLFYAHGIITIMRPEAPDFGGGLALAERGLAMAEKAGRSQLVSRLSRGLCLNYTADGRFDVARGRATALLAALEHTGDVERVSDLYLSTRWLLDHINYASDAHDLALASSLETFELAKRRGNRTMRSAVSTLLAPIHFLRGEYEEARRWADVGLELAEAIANVNAFTTSASIALATRLELGEAVDPAPYIDRIQQGLRAAGIMQLSTRFVGETLVAAGELDLADTLTETLVRSTGGRLRQAMVLLARADVLRHLGRFERAQRRYAQAIALAEAIGSRTTLASALLGAAEVAVAVGEEPQAVARAAALVDELRLERYRPRLRAVLGRGGGPPLSEAEAG